MSQNILLNGVVYTIPDVGDDNYGQNLTDYFVAIPSGVLQKSAGNFTLTADLNFGANFGVLSKFFSSRTANSAAAGLIRLANTESVSWRNAAASADLALSVNASNQLTFNGNPITPSTALTANRAVVTGTLGVFATSATTDTQVGYLSATTGTTGTGNIVLSAAPTLSGSVTLSALSTGLVHAGSGGALTSSLLVNADVSASAAIAFSKFAALTSGNILVGSAGNVATSVAMSGDATIVASGAITLATVNANVGSFGSSTAIPSFTVNAKGLLTAVGTVAVIAPAGTLSGATLASNVLASSLTSVGTLTGGATGAGFTVALGTSTISGTLPAANTAALAGDVTKTAGANNTVVAAIAGTTVSGTTGTGNVAFSAAPTFTGTITAAAITASGNITVSNNTASRVVTTDPSKVLTSAATTITQVNYLSSATGTTGTTSTNVVFSAAPTLSGVVDVNGNLRVRVQGLTLANGANNDVTKPTTGFGRISGVTGAFSITGIVAGADGEMLTLYNPTGNNMTIANAAAGSAAANRITTMTGADLVSTSVATVSMVYSTTDSSWLVTAWNA